MGIKYKYLVLSGLIAILISLNLTTVANKPNFDSIQAHFNYYLVDSMMHADSADPDLVILDVRSPVEYFPNHLWGAINRNFYDIYFNSLLGQLPKHKTYIIYCSAGTRSAQTFDMMVTMGFPSIIELLGGINLWASVGGPVTSALIPKQMAVSDTIIPDKQVWIGSTDTITLTITNRANDTLKFTSLTPLAGTEFTVNFDIGVKLPGPFDYTFQLFYSPTDTLPDSLTFRINSNGGQVRFHIKRTGKMLNTGFEKITEQQSLLRVFPNPFKDNTAFWFNPDCQGIINIEVYDCIGNLLMIQSGEISKEGDGMFNFEGASLEPGIYLVRIRTRTSSGSSFYPVKLIKTR